MFVVLNPDLFIPLLMDTLYPDAKSVQREVATKWMYITPNKKHCVSVNDEINGVHIDLAGTIDNIAELFQMTGIQANSPTQLIIEMYLKYGMEQLARNLEGNYTIMLLEYSINRPRSVLYVVQNHLGTRPLYTGFIPNVSSKTSLSSSRNGLFSPLTQTYDTYLFSETKEYLEAVREKYSSMVIETVPGGTYKEYHLEFGVSPKWKYHSTHTYYTLPISPFLLEKTKQNECVKDHDTHILRRIYDVLYAWLERWIRERENQPCIIVDTGDIESALLVAICRRITSQLEIPPPILYRVVLSQEEKGDLTRKVVEKNISTVEETLQEHTIIITQDELMSIAEQFPQDSRMISKWMPPYLVSKHLAKSEEKVEYVLSSSFLDAKYWSWFLEHRNIPYTNIISMYISNYKAFGGWLSAYIQEKNEMCFRANPDIVCETPIYRRVLVDILCQFSTETQLRWNEKGRTWQHELYEQITQQSFSPDEQWNAWEYWWDNIMDEIKNVDYTFSSM